MDNRSNSALDLNKNIDNYFKMDEFSYADFSSIQSSSPMHFCYKVDFFVQL